MATFKDLKRAVADAFRATATSDADFSAQDRLSALVKRVEALARENRTADRERAMRVSADGGMYVRGNVGSYASKAEGEQARRIIERLQSKAR